MVLLKLWNFLRGYVIINVNGYYIEKFINLCTTKGIYLWNIKRNQINNMNLRMSIGGFKQLRGIIKKTKCKVKIQKKVGIPFIKHRYRNRRFFFGGFILFLLTIYCLSMFIWVIEIHGVKDVSSQRIIDFLDSNGIKPGIIKMKIDKDVLISKMLIDIEEISWADISFIGTKVVVNVKERIIAPEIIDRKTPCHIYASKNGVIKDVITKNGVAKVKEGNVVKKGQLLISGIVESALYPGQVRIVHSDGEVKATTWYQTEMEFCTVQVKRERTGEYKTGFGFKIFSKGFDLYGRHSPYTIYDIEENLSRLSLLKNFELPIEIVTKKYYNVVLNKYTFTEENAQEELKKQVFNKLDNQVPKESLIVNRNIEFSNLGNNIIKAYGTYECIEEIGQKKKITND